VSRQKQPTTRSKKPRLRPCTKKDLDEAYRSLYDGEGDPEAALYYFRCKEKLRREAKKLEEERNKLRSRRWYKVNKKKKKK